MGSQGFLSGFIDDKKLSFEGRKEGLSKGEGRSEVHSHRGVKMEISWCSYGGQNCGGT